MKDTAMLSSKRKEVNSPDHPGGPQSLSPAVSWNRGLLSLCVCVMGYTTGWIPPPPPPP